MNKISYSICSIEIFEILLDWINSKFQDTNLESIIDSSPITFYKYLLKDNLNYIPHRSILKIFLKRFKAKSLLIEEDYIESDYINNYKYVYATSFIPVDRICRRIHFFNEIIKDEEDAKQKILLGGWSDNDIKNKYIGYIGLRPLPSFNVGKSVIPFDNKWDIELDSSEGTPGIPFLTCALTEKINLLGRKINIKNTVPFIQQDPIVGACSAASMWVTSYVFHKKYNGGFISYFEISDTTKSIPIEETNSVPLISGHTLYQMKETLSKCKISCHLYKAENYQSWLTTIYSMGYSNLPLILALKSCSKKYSSHAVVLVGHLIEQLEYISNTLKKEYGSPEDFIICKGELERRYYAHDDSYGPYNRITLEKSDTVKVYRGRYETKTYDLDSIILCFPSSSIRIFPESVFKVTKQILSKIFQKIPITIKESEKILLRPILTESNDFKCFLNENSFPNRIIEHYNLMHLPRHIWLVEISSFNIKKAEEQILGEIIYDTTGFYYRPQPLGGRIDQRLLSCDEKKDLTRKIIINDDVPSIHFKV